MEAKKKYVQVKNKLKFYSTKIFIQCLLFNWPIIIGRTANPRAELDDIRHKTIQNIDYSKDEKP